MVKPLILQAFVIFVALILKRTLNSEFRTNEKRRTYVQQSKSYR